MEILPLAEFFGAIDAWDEYLCIEQWGDGTFRLSSCSHPVLGYVHELCKIDEETQEYIIPAKIGSTSVAQEGDYIVDMEELVPHQDDAEVICRHGEMQKALDWMIEYGWNKRIDLGEIRSRIEKIIGTSA